MLDGVADFLDDGDDLIVGEVLTGDGDLAGFMGGFHVGDAADLADFFLDGEFAVAAGHTLDGVVLELCCHENDFLCVEVAYALIVYPPRV